jgi:hypothetical protein
LQRGLEEDLAKAQVRSKELEHEMIRQRSEQDPPPRTNRAFHMETVSLTFFVQIIVVDINSIYIASPLGAIPLDVDNDVPP